VTFDQIARRLGKQQQPPWLRTRLQLTYSPSTRRARSSPHAIMESWERSRRLSRGWLESLTVQLNQLRPNLGTALFWVPCHRLQDRLLAWMLRQLTPLLFAVLLPRSSNRWTQLLVRALRLLLPTLGVTRRSLKLWMLRQLCLLLLRI